MVDRWRPNLLARNPCSCLLLGVVHCLLGVSPALEDLENALEHDLLDFRRLEFEALHQLRDAVWRLPVVDFEPWLLRQILRGTFDDRRDVTRTEKILELFLILRLQHPLVERECRGFVLGVGIHCKRREHKSLRSRWKWRRRRGKRQVGCLLVEDSSNATVVDFHGELSLPEHASIRSSISALGDYARVVHLLVGHHTFDHLWTVDGEIALFVTPATTEAVYVVAQVLPETGAFRHRRPVGVAIHAVGGRRFGGCDELVEIGRCLAIL